MGDHFRSTVLRLVSPSIPAVRFGLEVVVDPYDFASICFVLLDFEKIWEGFDSFLDKEIVLEFGVVLEVMVSGVEGTVGTDDEPSVSSDTPLSVDSKSSLTSSGYSF